MTPADDNKLDQPLRNNSRNNNYSNGGRMNDESNNFQRDNNGRGGFSGGFRGGREGGGGGGMRGGGGFKNDDRRNHDNYDNRMDRGSNSMRGGGNYDDRRMSGRRMSRSRSRSPDFDDRKRRRRSRSFSPRRGDNNRDNNRGDSRREDIPRREREPSPEFDAPSTMSYRVTFRYFADWFRSVTPNPSGPGAVSEAFNAYKIEYARRQLLVVFEDNKRQAWFKDRYDPSKEAVEARKITRTQGRAGKMESFMDKVNRGELDDISFEQPVADPKPIEFKAVESKPVEEIESKPIEEEDKMDVDSDEVEQLLLGSSTAVIPTGPAKRSGMEVDEQTSTRQLFIKMIPVNLSRKQLEQHCAQAPGFEYLALSLPNPNAKYARVGYVQFKSEEDMPKATKILFESNIDKFKLHMAPTLIGTWTAAMHTPSIANNRQRIVKDLQQAKALATLFEVELDDARGGQWIEGRYRKALEDAGVKGDETNEVVDGINKMALDLYMAYLRNVFNTCYYCVSVCDFPEELNRTCFKHVRVPLTDDQLPATKNKEQAWARSLDKKIDMLIRKDADPAEFGGDSYEGELNKLCSKHVKLEEGGKFRCKECTKLFSAMKFIEKHILAKHAEVLGDTLERVQFFNNFVLDPSHVLPPPPTPRPPPWARKENEDNSKTSSARFEGRDNSNNDDFDRRRPSRDGNNANGGGGGDNRRGSSNLMDRIGDRDLSPPLPFDRRGGGRRRGDDYDYDSRGQGNGERASNMTGKLPPPPRGAVLDPRASRGSYSVYADLDAAPSGTIAENIVLNY